MQAPADVGGGLGRLAVGLLAQPPHPVLRGVAEAEASACLEGAGRGGERLGHAMPQFGIAVVQLAQEPPRRRHLDRPLGRPYRQEGQVVGGPAGRSRIVIIAGQAAIRAAAVRGERAA